MFGICFNMSFLFSGKNEGTMVINPKVIHQSNSRPKSEGKFFIFSEFSNSFLFVKTYKIHFKVIERVDLARPMVDISNSNLCLKNRNVYHLTT